MTGMNALQLHQVISAVTAVMRPLIVSARMAGVNSSATVGAARSLRAASSAPAP